MVNFPYPTTSVSESLFWIGLEIAPRRQVYAEVFFHVPLESSPTGSGLKVFCIDRFDGKRHTVKKSRDKKR